MGCLVPRLTAGPATSDRARAFGSVEEAADHARTLREDTALHPTGDRFMARISEDWRLYGPLGGYLAALALRAAGSLATAPQPNSASVQFVNPPVRGRMLTLVPRVIKRSPVAECVGVGVSQEGRAVLEAVFWFAADGDGPEPYGQRRRIDVDPRSLQPLDDVPGRKQWPWERVIQRIPVVPFEEFWADAVEHPVLDPPVGEEWFRFRNRAQFDDPVLEAARLLIVADAAPWLAIHFGRIPVSREFFPSTTSLSVQFNCTSDLGEYLLARGEGAGIRHGAYAGTGTIWAEDGRLLASALQGNQLRRLPRQGRSA